MTSITLPLSDGSGRLGYREAGQGAPLVLIHGVGLQSAAWSPQIDALSDSHHVYALDMPGHGDSSPLPEGSELPDFVAWLDRAVATFGLTRFSLAGHSMGALIAGGYAVTHPDKVARVALVNGVFRRDPAARAAVEERARQLREGQVDHDTPLDRWFGDAASDRAARARVAEWLHAVDLGGYATAYGAFSRGDATYADRFGAIRCPLLALTGSEDRNSAPEMSQAMAAAAPKGKALIVEGHRHMVNLTAPEMVTAAMRDWLALPDAEHEAA
ncbi:alpha/beta fold hydrolase [Rhodobacter sp. NTK016B]|uniref:alpha/beta fold hydrolase n=1 Tax=Rhodobacter sp. NTK016B TaxID=2759676 RepID=UPI001A8CEC0C|nr:alpha/beta hydrolase [Rhodobacter sp. NTK016B]MBN8292703.1 alpha/beta fold hydrolase [Rhodobacter sp. NTK016B]